MKYATVSLLALGLGLALSSQGMAQERLSLSAAIEKAQQHSPEAAAIKLLRQQAQSRILNAATRPNPEFGFELENIAGSSPQQSTEAAELTYSLSQTIELGGKRQKRLDVAHTARRADILAAETRLRQLTYSTQLAYLEAVAAEKRLAFTAEQAALAQRLYKAVKKRIDAGRDANTNLINAEVTLRQAEMAHNNAQVNVQLAHNALAAILGEEHLIQPLDTTVLANLPEAPQIDADLLNKSPQAQLAQLSVHQAEQALQLAKTNAYPDPTVNVGLRQFRETDSEAFLLGVSIPLPVFDSNKGGIAAARADLAEAQLQAKQTLLTLRHNANLLQTQAATYRTQVEYLQDKVIPLADEAEDNLSKHYAQGRLTLLDVLSAQTSLKQAQEQLLDMQLAYHRSVTELQRLLPAQSVSENQ